MSTRLLTLVTTFNNFNITKMKKLIASLAILMVILPSLATAVEKYATVYNPITSHRKQVMIGSEDAFKDGYKLETKELMLGAKPFRPTSYETTLSS